MTAARTAVPTAAPTVGRMAAPTVGGGWRRRRWGGRWGRRWRGLSGARSTLDERRTEDIAIGRRGPDGRRSGPRTLRRRPARLRRRMGPAAAPRDGGRAAAPFGDLLDLDGVDELLSRRGLRTPFLRMAKDGAVVDSSRFTRPGGVGAAIGDQVDDTAVARLFADGTTIVLQALHRLWPPIIDFAGELAGELGHPGSGQRVHHAAGVARVLRALRHPRRVRPPARGREAVDRPRARPPVAAPDAVLDPAPRTRRGGGRNHGADDRRRAAARRRPLPSARLPPLGGGARRRVRAPHGRHPRRHPPRARRGAPRGGGGRHGASRGASGRARPLRAGRPRRRPRDDDRAPRGPASRSEAPRPLRAVSSRRSPARCGRLRSRRSPRSQARMRSSPSMRVRLRPGLDVRVVTSETGMELSLPGEIVKLDALLGETVDAILRRREPDGRCAARRSRRRRRARPDAPRPRRRRTRRRLSESAVASGA